MSTPQALGRESVLKNRSSFNIKRTKSDEISESPELVGNPIKEVTSDGKGLDLPDNKGNSPERKLRNFPILPIH